MLPMFLWPQAHREKFLAALPKKQADRLRDELRRQVMRRAA